MSTPIARLLQHPSLRDGVRRALESGVGLYHATWHLEAAPFGGAEPLAEELLGWCRDVLGRTHRPYGLGSVTLALALVDEGGRRIASTTFRRLQPADFYGAGPAEAQIGATLRRWSESGIVVRGSRSRLSVALFSWGDLAWALLLAG